MCYANFIKSYLFTRKGQNLSKLGFDFNLDPESEYLKVQSILYTEYHIKCESMITMMKTFNIPSSKTMDILFRLFDIEARSLSDAASQAILLGRNELNGGVTFTNIYHTSWHGQTFLLRSSYEEVFAKQLDDSKTLYFVEHMRIKYFDKVKNKYRIAIPDFYLPETNTIVEIKSSYWLDEEEMRNKKSSYLDLGYKFKLCLDHVLLENW